ncbi:hypothetical protein L226DRAFT_468560 [Lentinus tigrinus ALCF2SS1-7]|uniref:Uncharacterized protein n=1 Tax=Lentinus tigrinus ALCF2SS1-6 TaxID=1328759 RepID=A0A5C2RZB3_9APHY|nr:hypothetical protein L227DRAFT_588091 [Lentinus tigrinus ALCF2SS1-6]RPD71433.1 hypothetical protein L226DRAFT_468560 [Lentinus tigrinus ALCF2SS1-7]
MHAFVLGGSKNIGYHAALRLLKQGTTVTFLLRSTSVFDNDEQMQPFVRDGKAQLMRGDALNLDDVRRAWEAAVEAGGGTVDIVLFTIGGQAGFSMSRGFVLNIPDLCTHALLNVLSTIPDSLRAPETQPHFVITTSMGITSESHATIPLALKPLYNGVLPAMHADKLCMERVLVFCGGLPWSSKDEPNKDILPDGWQSTQGLPSQGELKHVVVIRPALLTDGKCRGDETRKAGKAPYRTKKDGDLSSAWRISRQDVAHFIVQELLPNWSGWEGSGVVLAY